MKRIFLLFVIALLAACSSNDEEQQTGEENPSSDQEDPSAKQQEASVYPLTGEETDAEVMDRIVAVMVNNHPKARPQTGLAQADITFEILAEGNITRFLALYQSDMPDRVGPVRSARPYYFDLAEGYDAIYVYHGAANFIEEMIQNGSVQGLNGMYYDNDKALFERSAERVAPHNSYTIFDGIYQEAEEQGYSLESSYQPLSFLAEDEEVTGEEATEIAFAYASTNRIRYQYNSDSEKYQRYSDDELTVEYADDQPIELDNILFIEAAHQVVDDAGRREIDLESGGDALLLQQGKVQYVQWERNNGRIIPMKDGEPVSFVPGQTWINVIPKQIGIDEIELTP
ncbi:MULTISPECIES: DUF3048 domain-containing protein [Gracilibacillus]|uniref:DUF3048 domain-containing protein n=1 Tax=Gracilibacillus TaxID=74385 RepID=UPI0008248537|nr:MULTISPECIES: DUF3048 domain-containing protein [Gracilibacillus]